METILIGLAATGAVIPIALLVIVSAGIRRHDHSGSLATQPPGPATALARKLLALHATPITGHQLSTQNRPASLANAVSQARWSVAR